MGTKINHMCAPTENKTSTKQTNHRKQGWQSLTPQAFDNAMRMNYRQLVDEPMYRVRDEARGNMRYQ